MSLVPSWLRYVLEGFLFTHGYIRTLEWGGSNVEKCLFFRHLHAVLFLVEEIACLLFSSYFILHVVIFVHYVFR